MAAFVASQATDFKTIHVATAVGARNYRVTRTLIETASGCRTFRTQAGEGIVVNICGADRTARRAAALMIHYRASILHDASMPVAVRTELFDATNTHEVVLPEDAVIRDVRRALFHKNAIYVASSEMGVLVDVASLDEHRVIRALSTSVEARDKMAVWIRAKVDGTLEDARARRTVAHIVSLGFVLARVRRVVDTLEDKSDVQEALNRLIDASATPDPEPEPTNVLLDESTGPTIVKPKKPECIVCLDADACHAFLPCGHMVACSKCAHEIFQVTSACPTCRTPATGHLRIFV